MDIDQSPTIHTDCDLRDQSNNQNIDQENETENEFNPESSLSALKASVASVEANLAPLFKTTWSDIVAHGSGSSSGSTSAIGSRNGTGTSGGMSTLERAKMDVLVAYAINDLIWVYLKMKGIDPSTHEVTPELERISTYYDKIRKVEQPEARRKTSIDKPAAHRFIAASIPSSQRLPVSTDSSAKVEIPSTSGASSARASARQRIKEESESESLERVGMSNRFRFVGGAQEDERGKGMDEDIEMEIHGGEEGEGDEAEELLNDLKSQLERTSPAGVTPEQGGDSTPVLATAGGHRQGRPRRKRAEDLA